MKKTRREVRLEDFEGRASYAPRALYSATGIGRYVTVHPMSDELSLLKKLGILPEDCIKVDCYWNIDDDVHFVQIFSRKCDTSDSSIIIGGIWGRMKHGRGYKANFVTTVDYDAVSREAVESSLASIRDVYLNRPPLLYRAYRRLR